MAFGQTVADSNSNSEAWIKGFKDGVTRIRIVQELPTWIKYQQHFSKVAFYFPCSKDKDCVGCLYPDELNDEGEPKKSYQYAFNALDEKGNKNIYRLGTNAFKILQSRHQRLGTLTDRDHNIVRSGKGFDTTYIPEPGDKYEVDLPEELIDIQNALALKYEEAREATLKAIEAEKQEAALAAAEGVATPTEGLAEPKEAGPLRTAGKKAEDEAQASVESGENAVDFEDMSTGDIKDWLAARKVDIPSRAARAALIKLAETNRGTPPF